MENTVSITIRTFHSPRLHNFTLIEGYIEEVDRFSVIAYMGHL
jgi:hypothetical protein